MNAQPSVERTTTDNASSCLAVSPMFTDAHLTLCQTEQQRSVKTVRSNLLLATALLSTTLLGVCGCKSPSYSDRFGFGTIDRQKAKAADFDPYPLNDIGPSVVGGRPPGFFNPLPEPRRNELQAQNKRYAYP